MRKESGTRGSGAQGHEGLFCAGGFEVYKHVGSGRSWVSVCLWLRAPCGLGRSWGPLPCSWDLAPAPPGVPQPLLPPLALARIRQVP